MPNIGQLSYSVFPAQATPGMIFDLGFNQILSGPANEVINPGRLLQVSSDGTAFQQVQNTSTDTITPPSSVGVAILKTAREGLGAANVVTPSGGGQYQPGDIVPVLFRGTVWCQWSGTTQPKYGNLNVYHSSTVATNRGIFTDVSASSTAGSEVSPAGGFIRTRVLPVAGNTGNLVLLDVNLPASTVVTGPTGATGATGPTGPTGPTGA